MDRADRSAVRPVAAASRLQIEMDRGEPAGFFGVSCSAVVGVRGSLFGMEPVLGIADRPALFSTTDRAWRGDDAGTPDTKIVCVLGEDILPAVHDALLADLDICGLFEESPAGRNAAIRDRCRGTWPSDIPGVCCDDRVGHPGPAGAFEADAEDKLLIFI